MMESQKKALLLALGLTLWDIPRFRHIEVDEDHIVVTTRAGGENREAYADDWALLRRHACYMDDFDDEDDSTYAYVYFRFPAEVASVLEKIAATTDPDAQAHAYQELLAALEG
jgi:hypothetical protein